MGIEGYDEFSSAAGTHALFQAVARWCVEFEHDACERRMPAQSHFYDSGGGRHSGDRAKRHGNHRGEDR